MSRQPPSFVFAVALGDLLLLGFVVAQSPAAAAPLVVGLHDSMGKRRKNPVAKPSLAIYDDAFRLQEGEYWPEHHQANVKALCEKYPEYSPEEVDAIYRKACNLELKIEEWLNGMELSPGSRTELLEWLEDHYYGFTEASFLWALERVEDKRK